MHRGRRLLQAKLRDHAIAMGILKEGDLSAPTAQTISPPTDINAYRSKRRAV